MIPKYLKLQNFLSHDVSEIDFDKFNVALILGTYDNESDQSNGAGKSAIFEAIVWALFGKSRHKKKDGVIKWNCRACRVEYTFWVDEVLYKITRTRDKIIGASDVVFEQFNGTQFISIDCDTNTLTDNKIIATINVNYEVFLNSVYFKQDDISMFATTTPSKRKDVLKALLKMGKWDEYQKNARDKAKVLKNKIEEKTSHIVPMLEIASEISECNITIKDLKKSIKDGNVIYAEINSDLMSKKLEYQSKYSNGNMGVGDLRKTQKEFSEFKSRVKEIKLKTADNNNTIISNNNKVSGLKQKINLFKERIKEKNGINISLYRNKLIEGRTKEKMLSEHASELKKEIKLSDNCEVCLRPLSKKEIVEIKKQRIVKLNETQKKYKIVHTKVLKATRSLQEKEKIVSSGIKAELDKEKGESKTSRLQNEIDFCLNENKRLGLEQEKAKDRDFEKEIKDLKDKCDKEAEETLRDDIVALESAIKDKKKVGDRLNIDYGSKIRRRDEIIKLQKSQEVLQKEINKLKSEFSIYDKLRGYFGKDGVQSIIIENVIEELENYSNDTLSKICNEPTSISIKTQKQNDNGSWAETFDILVKAGARTDDFDTFSGGEKFRISLALRLALSNILSKRMGGEIKFLLLDEVSSNLDNKGLNMFIDIVKQLSIDIKILVITHSERLKEKFEDVIIVDKGVNGSKATFY